MTELEQKIADMEKQLAALKAPATPVTGTPLKLDLGCGKTKPAGWVGVDIVAFPGVDVVHDLGSKTWPWADSSVDEVQCLHTVEHFTWEQRVFFFNELWRVMKPNAKAQIVTPHWSSMRHYGDPTHKTPMSEFVYPYLLKSWRTTEAPHVDAAQNPGPLSYSCDFSHVIGYSITPALNGRNQDFLNFAIQHYKDAVMDFSTTLTCLKP